MSKRREQVARFGGFGLTGIFFDVQDLYDAVVDIHRVALGAHRAQTAAGCVESKADRLGKLAVAVGEEDNLAVADQAPMTK